LTEAASALQDTAAALKEVEIELTQIVGPAVLPAAGSAA
jgi:hypothetical protein